MGYFKNNDFVYTYSTFLMIRVVNNIYYTLTPKVPYILLLF